MQHRSAVARWLLVCALLFGLVVMHHIATHHATPVASPTAHASQAAPDHGDAGPDDADSLAAGHDSSTALGHLCLAVLAGVAVLVLTGRLVALRRSKDAAARAPVVRRAGARAPPHPFAPGRGNFSHHLCVLRL
ncbi:DUF6153 family protein [Prauserella oleivorans]|uniref:DUF6153 family protein n=1 Tax=Prauserella oleivorans TaxID=1478153 RepID=A0ABW5W3R3_9PSEU